MRDRRAFLGAVFGVVLSAPSTTFAQPPSPNLRRIGFLGFESASDEARRLEALRAGLRDLGYVEGKNIVIEIRLADGNYDRLPALAARHERPASSMVPSWRWRNGAPTQSLFRWTRCLP